MPPLEHQHMTTTAVLWSMVRHDRDGFPLVSAPEQIRVRWEEADAEMVDDEGNRIRVDVVLTAPRQLVTGSLLWEGELASLPLVDGVRTPPRDLYEVISRVRGKDLKGRLLRYEFGLRRYKDRLPTIAPPA